jgi:hypothetical protein
VLAITEDASTPTGKTGTGTSRTITSNAFSPPPIDSRLVALISGEWSDGTVSATVEDTGLHVWELVSLATGDDNGGMTAIYTTYMDAAPGSITVTARFTGLGGGRLLDVRVLNGTDPSQSPATGWAGVRTSSSVNNARGSITTTVAGSVVYGVSNDPIQQNTFTAVAGTTALTQHSNAVDETNATSWKTGATVTPATGVLVGGLWTSASAGNISIFEVIPTGSVDTSPTMPTFVDGTVVTAADLNSIGINIANLYDISQGGVRYSPYVAGGKGPTKPLGCAGSDKSDLHGVNRHPPDDLLGYRVPQRR